MGTTILPNNATNEITGFYSYFQWVQEATDNLFMPSILFGLFVILFVMFRAGTNNTRALLGSSFIIMVASIFLTAMGFLSANYMYVTILITAISAVLAYVDNTVE